MEVTYRRNLHKSYMCVESQEKSVEAYEIQMVRGRKIPHLLELETVFSEGETEYLYDISGKQQLEDYLSGKKMGYGALWDFLCGVQGLCVSLSDYLLREDGVCLESEYIYVSLEDGSLYFTYLPCFSQSFPDAFERYMEQVLRRVDHQDQAAAELAYQVYQMCIVENASIRGILEQVGKQGLQAQEDFAELRVAEEPVEHVGSRLQEQEAAKLPPRKQKLSEKLSGEVAGWVENKPALANLLHKCKTMIAGGITEKEACVGKAEGKSRVFQGKGIKSKTCKVPMKTRGSDQKEEGRKEKATSQDQGKGMEVAHPTEILGVYGKEPIGRLAYQGRHGCGDILMEGEEMLLGKNREQAGGVIEAEGVSRLHARITKQGGSYYLEDLNSTNGTFLNGEPLEYRQKKKLSKDDRIRFGAEEYLFS